MSEEEELVSSKKEVSVLLIEMGLDEWTQEIPLEIKKLANMGRLLSIGKPSDLVSKFFDDHYDLRHSVALECGQFVDLDEYAIDRLLYNELRHFEGAALKMMDRLPIFQEWEKSDLSDRRRMLFRETSFWSDYLERNEVGAVVFPAVPHQVYDFIIYSLCKSRGIRTLIFDSANPIIRDVVGVSETIEGIGDLDLGLKIRASFSKSDLSIEPQNVVSDFWSARANMLTDLDPKALSIQRMAIRSFKVVYSRFSVSKLLRRNNEKTSGQYSVNLVKRFRRRFALIRTRYELLRVQNICNLPENFVFFPLHVQPELAVSPLGGHFEEQLEAIRLVARYLPSGWKIVVKEHPDQSVYWHRPSGFYKNLSQVSEVDFVGPNFSVNELLKVCRAVITISSSIGRQAIITGRPVGLLGSTWWSAAPGVFKVSTGKEMQKMFAQLKSWEPPAREELDRYVKNLQSSTFSAVLYGQPAGMNREKLAEVKSFTLSNIPMIIGTWLNLGRDAN